MYSLNNEYKLGGLCGLGSTVCGLIVAPPANLLWLLIQMMGGVITAMLSACAVHYVNRWLKRRDRDISTPKE